MSNSQPDNSTTRNKTILEMESRLDELVKTDIRNEEIYTILNNLAHIYINQNKFYFGYNGIDEVCHDVAADVWMSVIEGRIIKSWMYYIGKMLKLSYIPSQKSLEHEIIDVNGDPDLSDTIKQMCAGSSMSFTREFDDMERNLMLDNIGSMIYNTMHHTKFKPKTKEFLLLSCNVSLNLYNDLLGYEYEYFRLPDTLKPYVGIVIEQFKKDFRNSGFTDSIADGVENDLEMQLTSDENYMKEVNNKKI